MHQNVINGVILGNAELEPMQERKRLFGFTAKAVAGNYLDSDQLNCLAFISPSSHIDCP